MSNTDGFDDLDDATVVRAVPVDDATIVRPRRAADLDDATVVRARPVADNAEADDRTVVRARHGAATPTTTASVAPPVEDDTVSGRSMGVTTLPALDPERRIASVPGRAPWEPELEPERGVRPGATVVYGARSEFRADPALGPDLLHQRLGDAPAAAPVSVRESRTALPSMERRARRARAVTLIGYGTVVVIAVGGLSLIARLALG